jgi:hypothetical protein
MQSLNGGSVFPAAPMLRKYFLDYDGCMVRHRIGDGAYVWPLLFVGGANGGSSMRKKTNVACFFCSTKF